MTFSMSKQILESAPLHHTLCVRLADVNDLIAAEAKYHLVCLRAFERSTSKNGEGMCGDRSCFFMAVQRARECGRERTHTPVNRCME